MRALNFYSSIYEANLVVRNKRCTIRLGDKRDKYREGDIVVVTYGDRFKPRKKIFQAVIDRVTVKTIGELTKEDLEGENPDMKTPQDALEFLRRIYEVPMDENTLVTVIYFSELVE